MKARCMKCKDQREMKDGKVVQTARGGYMAKGLCIVCDCGMCKILSKADAEAAVTSGKLKKEY